MHKFLRAFGVLELKSEIISLLKLN